MSAQLSVLQSGPQTASERTCREYTVSNCCRGGVPLNGEGAAFDPEAQVLATADGHPRAVGYLSRLPAPTLAGIRRHAFYDGLLTAQGQPRSVSESLTGTGTYPALLAAARLDARRMNVGWVLIWPCPDRQCSTSDIIRYLAADRLMVRLQGGRRSRVPA
jgi:hypothetical protein